MTTFKKVVDVHAHRIDTLQRELELAESRLAESVRTKDAASESAKELINTANIEKDQRKRAEERVARLEKDLEGAKRQLAKAAASAAKNKGRRETDPADGGSERDSLNALLQCSSCKERYRDRILTKCFHTFCRVLHRLARTDSAAQVSALRTGVCRERRSTSIPAVMLCHGLGFSLMCMAVIMLRLWRVPPSILSS